MANLYAREIAPIRIQERNRRVEVAGEGQGGVAFEQQKRGFRDERLIGGPQV